MKKRDWFEWTVICLVGLWLLVPSSLFIKINSIQIVGDRVYIQRDVLINDIPADYREELTTPEGLICSASGRSDYEMTDKPRSWPLGDMLKCLVPGASYKVTYRARVFFGLVPLKRSTWYYIYDGKNL